METTGLAFGPLSPGTAHLCIDMQRLFTAAGPWPVPWIEKIMPTVVAAAQRFPSQTIFTRFVPPQDVHQVPGMWQLFYRRWSEVTLRNLDTRLLDLVPPLHELVPPATTCERWTYSCFGTPALDRHLRTQGIDTLVVTGGETDVCVLATVLGAIDRGYRVVLVADALCSTSDESHDSILGLFTTRYSQQVETITSDALFAAWEPR
jgi:nicotinamidase-related amidase